MLLSVRLHYGAIILSLRRIRISRTMRRYCLSSSTEPILNLDRLQMGILNSILREDWRRGSESNRRIKVLQTSPLPLGYRALSTTYRVTVCVVTKVAIRTIIRYIQHDPAQVRVAARMGVQVNDCFLRLSHCVFRAETVQAPVLEVNDL